MTEIKTYVDRSTQPLLGLCGGINDQDNNQTVQSNKMVKGLTVVLVLKISDCSKENLCTEIKEL